MKIMIINGPNLNMLGVREPKVYGSETLAHIEKLVKTRAKQLDVYVEVRQSNSEGELVNMVQDLSSKGYGALIINPAAFTHTSVALRDALATFDGKKVEVHLSNTYKRESFRKVKLTSAVCDSVIEGFGFKGYLLALESLV
jgi:3-dehydroquinate dehydratase-2